MLIYSVISLQWFALPYLLVSPCITNVEVLVLELVLR